jgi:hypothetical protein
MRQAANIGRLRPNAFVIRHRPQPALMPWQARVSEFATSSQQRVVVVLQFCCGRIT